MNKSYTMIFSALFGGRRPPFVRILCVVLMGAIGLSMQRLNARIFNFYDSQLPSMELVPPTGIPEPHRAAAAEPVKKNVQIGAKQPQASQILVAKSVQQKRPTTNLKGTNNWSQGNLAAVQAANNNETPKTKTKIPGKPILPNILIIGAQKAGSTALSDWLFSMGVCGGTIVKGEPSFYKKEPHFFDRDDRWAKGKDFYKQRFAHCATRNQKWRLDATPTTMQHPDRVYNTYRTVRNIKKLRIVVSLREPIARELSLYNHQLSQFQRNPDMTEWYAGVMHPDGKTPKTFDQFVETVTIPNLGNNVSSSALAHYSGYLQRWYELFEPQQILVISYQHDIRQSNRAKTTLRQFIGHPFPTGGGFPVTNTHASDSKVKTMSCAARDRLQAIYEPWNQELYALLHRQAMTLPEEERPPPFPQFTLPDCVGDDQQVQNSSFETARDLLQKRPAKQVPLYARPGFEK